MEKICPNCKLSKNVGLFSSCKSRKIFSWCKECVYTLQKRRWRERKFQVIKMMGGKCSKCDYNKCYNALELHHLDPVKKDFDWNQLRMRKWSIIIDEIKKCILVCANCHREIHALKEDYTLTGKANSSLNIELIAEGKCFSPTCNEPTYGTKFCSKECCFVSNRKVERPSREELVKMISESSFCAIGRAYNVSDNAVRKWAKFYGIL